MTKFESYLKERNIPIDSLEANSIQEGIQWTINEAIQWVDKNKHFHKELSFGSLSTDWNKFIRAFRKDMEALL